jgi:putative ABC transport system permease protein
MTFTAVKTSVNRLGENYDSYLESQNLEDFYFNMGEIDTSLIPGRVLWDLCKELSIENECAYDISKGDEISYNHLNVLLNNRIKEVPDVYENVIDNLIHDFVNDNQLTYEKNYTADVVDGDKVYKFITNTQKIDLPYLVDGRLPNTYGEIAIFPEFAKNNNISIGDHIKILDSEYIVTGFIYKVDYLFPIFSMKNISFDPQKQTIVITTKDTMEDLHQDLFLKYLVKGDLSKIYPDFGYNDLQAKEYSVLGKQMSMLQILLPANINFRVIALKLEIDNANSFIDLFLPLFIGIVAVLLILFMKRYIEKNRKDLDILNSIGYTKTELVTAMISFPVLVSLMSIIGYIIGLYLSKDLFAVYSSRYLYPKAPFSVDLKTMLWATVLPIFSLTTISIIFTLFGLKKREHLMIKRFVLFKFIEVKTILYSFSLFLLVSVLILFGLNGNNMFSDFIDHTKLGNHYSEMIYLQNMNNDPYPSSYETFTKIRVKIIKVNLDILQTEHSTTLYGIKPETTLKLLIDDNPNKNLLLSQGIIISEYFHTANNIHIGDTLTLEIGNVQTEQKVVGVSNELIENNIYMDQSKLNSLYDLDSSYYNGLFASDYNYQSPKILTKLDYNDTLNQFSSVLNVSSSIINYLVILSITLSILSLILILSNFMIDHQKDISIFKSLGYYNKEIHKKYILPLYVFSFTAFLISIPLTDKLLNTLFDSLLTRIGFKLVISIKFLTIVFGLLIIHLVFIMIIYVFSTMYEKASLSLLLKRNDD